MKYRNIPFTEYQQRANQLLDFFGITAESSIPIDPEIFLRQIGFDIVPYPGLWFRFGLKGAVIKVKDKRQVWIDEDHYFNQPESSLLTLGEELGHIILHLDEDSDDVSSIRDWISKTTATEEYYDYIENQARTFASNIILPSFIFDPFTLGWVSKNLDIIKERNNTTREDLAYNIASLMSDVVSVSPYIIEITLNRWPNPLIDQILEKHPELINRKK